MLQVTRVVPAPPEKVWRALTDPSALASWFWPDRFATTAQIDLHAGGRYRMDGPGVGIAVNGEYLSVEAPHRLTFTWHWDGEPDQTLVTMELTPSGAGCELTVTHERFSEDATRDDHIKGWEDCLDRLPEWLHRTRPDTATGGPQRAYHQRAPIG